MSKKKSKLKMAIIIFLILAGIGVVFEMTGITEKKTVNGTPNKIEYEVVEKGDISFGNTVRPEWSVVVGSKVSAEELKELSKEVIEIAKKEAKFNAIVVWFYDYEEYIGHGYTLGKVEYAPDGDWSKADTVKTGDYKKMDYKYNLMEKDWDKQLTREEVDVYKAWKDLYKELDTGSNLPDEGEVSKEIAERFNISEEDVNEIMLKQSVWFINDKSK